MWRRREPLPSHPLDPIEPDPLPSGPPRVPVAVTVEVATTNGAAKPDTTAQAPITNTVSNGRAEQRVQLVNVFGDILTEAITPANGQSHLDE
jgi:hypothetical protein